MKLDIHLHSFFSDGIHSPAAMAAQVKRLGLDGFALTDHDTVKGHRIAKQAAKKLKLVFIPGIEVTSKDGHILGLFVTKNIRKGMSAAETVKKIHGQGGIAIATHAFDPFRSSVHNRIGGAKFDYIEVFNSRVPIPTSNWKAQKVAKELNLKMVSGSDAHAIEEIGFGTIEVRNLNGLRNGKVKIHNAKWAWPWLIVYGKFRGVLKKYGLY